MLERYEEKLIQGCGHAELDWPRLNLVLLQWRTFMQRHGTVQEDNDLSVRELALIAAIGGCVKVPEKHHQRVLAKTAVERDVPTDADKAKAEAKAEGQRKVEELADAGAVKKGGKA